MDSGTEPTLPAVEPAAEPSHDSLTPGHLEPVPPPPETPYRGLKWAFVGPDGMRAGWSATTFIALFLIFTSCLTVVMYRMNLVGKGTNADPGEAFAGELAQVISLVAAAAIMAVIEGRRILDYNLRGPKPVVHFLSGCVAGFAALSALVGSLALGGWLHFGPVALHGSQIVKYAIAWGATFLLVGCLEEGTMRCYLQYTFTRGINFWWAAGIIALICLFLISGSHTSGGLGVYIVAILGVGPCLLLEMRKTASAGFWQAAWLTTALFGFMHTGNKGENWVGILGAALIGFVFCVSIWVTGSAWWAIGCHAAWDWAETYFYGTADSGMIAKGHLLTTSPSGTLFWSGGSDGPEGSILVFGICLVMLAWLLIVYRRPVRVEPANAEPAEQLAS